ncbi:tRNA (guanine(6)-N2)-methyltransferase THUMP3-like [Mytilus californianus]|uniref:tRNA (guanine(6)-N2)-methyltransferase THUMP3-like n=1 Tax=Mytilus californianus TaxID=6549 RepID=UPI002247D177|nr:tRNA (guanine(6)-N2)-methyltransferase THUMP3-like [Mytilus californianus]
MSAPIDHNMSTDEKDILCEIEATVTTGFEPTAMEEAVEKLNAEVTVSRGRIVLKVPISKVKKVLELGCVDNCYVLMTKVSDFKFSEDELESMARLRELVKSVDWETGLRAWREVFTFKQPINSKPDIIPDVLGEPQLSSRIHKPKKGDNGGKKSKRQKMKERMEKKKEERKKFEESKISSDNNVVDKDSVTMVTGLEDIKNLDKTSQRLVNYKEVETVEKKIEDNLQDAQTAEDAKQVLNTEPVSKKPKLTEYSPDKPAFRVTCHRTGLNHSFDSMGAQSNFGGAVYNYFKWNVSMKEFDIEVMLYIDSNDVRVGLALTRQSLHRRHTIAFGPTTLRPTIAYNMLRMCKIQPGEIICDPMCGSGVIPIQAALYWPEGTYLAGEIVKRAIDRTVENVEYVNKLQAEKEKPDIKVQTIKWDASNLPLQDESVTVFITDLPFGVRLGSKKENSSLYPKVLHEMSRVTKLKSGRVCLLTQDKKGINKAMQLVSKYWKRTNAVGINMGGLAACVYMMYRNSEVFDKSQPLVIPSFDETSPSKNYKKLQTLREEKELS